MAAVIRAIQPDDAAQFVQLLSRLDAESPFTLYEAQEREPDIPRMVQRLLALEAHGKDQVMVAVSHDMLIGYASASRGRARELEHTAQLGIGVLREWQRQGLGFRLLNAIDAWARHTGITRLDLGVMANNFAAIALYERSGFHREGTKRSALKLGGEYCDEIIMAKWLA